jgi:LuxR family transcriptional regulator, maltose regulon positive regulatory protein
MPSDSGERNEAQLLQAGGEALARGAWREAYACFNQALEQLITAEALEGLGMAAWGLNETATTFDARERAYRLYRQQGDNLGAARVATGLALDHLYYRGEYAIAGGWVQRARRLLGGVPPCAEQGWLAVVEAQIIGWVEHDFAAAQRLCSEAAALGHSLANLDLEMVALACEGLGLVSQGYVSEGMRRLDEAALAAAAGEMSDIDATCTACCCLIFACEWTRDHERARQWLERLKALSTRGAHPTMFYFCRTHYAGLLVWQGAWREAESELATAIAELEGSQPALAAEALVRLAHLRCRQGHFAAAEALLARAEEPPFRALAADFCLLGRAQLALCRSDVAAAVDLGERFLRAVPPDNRLERVAGLELLIPALVARGDRERAAVLLAELRYIAGAVGTEPMQAALHFASGFMARAAADDEEARRCFEDAAELWRRSQARYETALARLELARTLLGQGRFKPAREQTEQAQAVLNQLGGQPAAAQAARLLQEIASSQAAGRTTNTGHADLTPRELEVLSLLAAGKSNQEISQQLVLSVRTTERHISNIYAKIGASGRSARAIATAYALNHHRT